MSPSPEPLTSMIQKHKFLGLYVTTGLILRYTPKLGITVYWFKNKNIECFHMTSRRPYWCPKTMKWRPCWCPKPILWELNSFLMQTLSFVPTNLHRCWPREWKHSILLLLSSTTKTKRNMHQEKWQKYSSKTSSDWSIDLCILRDAYQKLFCIFEVTKSLVMGEPSFQCCGCFYTDSPVINKVIITKITTGHPKRSLNWWVYYKTVQ